MKTAAPTRDLEQQFWKQGMTVVAGVDEVGRGPLAGPVCVAAVVLPVGSKLVGVTDSKLLSAVRRQALARQIKATASCIGIGWATNREIDTLGLTTATRRAATRALTQIADCQQVLLDGSHDYIGTDYIVHTSVKADQSSLVVAAASIIAKVARDSYMELLDTAYPDYGFAKHKGYGSALHLAALKQHGPTPHHRYSFRSVKQLCA